MTPTIRSATAADIPELARLRWQLYTKQGPPGESFDVYVGRFTTFATDALSGGHWPAWVAERDGSLITALWLQTVPRVPAPWARRTRPIGYLTNAFVQPDHASQGLGSRLLQTVVA